MNDYMLLAIGNLEDAYRTFEASAPRDFRLLVRKHVLGTGAEERARAYNKVCATVLLQSMCYKYLQDEKNAEMYLNKARQFFEEYAEAEKTALYNREVGRFATLNSKKMGFPPKHIPYDAIRRAIDQKIDDSRKMLEAISG